MVRTCPRGTCTGWPCPGARLGGGGTSAGDQSRLGKPTVGGHLTCTRTFFRFEVGMHDSELVKGLLIAHCSVMLVSVCIDVHEKKKKKENLAQQTSQGLISLSGLLIDLELCVSSSPP